VTVAETTPFSPHVWESFYVIVGSTAGALVGLQFVVLTLITEAGLLRGSSETLAAFASPNVVHFCAALLIAAIFSAPWHDMGVPDIAAALIGVGGFIYSVAVLRRARRQRDYKPVLEDWIWHAGLPILAYGSLLVAGFLLARAPEGASFIVGGSALLLVFIGIHNAWDTVTYVTLERVRENRARVAAQSAQEHPPAPGSAPAAGKLHEPHTPPPARRH
jgi:hypothetical protein